MSHARLANLRAGGRSQPQRQSVGTQKHQRREGSSRHLGRQWRCSGIFLVALLAAGRGAPGTWAEVGDSGTWGAGPRDRARGPRSTSTRPEAWHGWSTRGAFRGAMGGAVPGTGSESAPGQRPVTVGAPEARSEVRREARSEVRREARSEARRETLIRGANPAAFLRAGPIEWHKNASLHFEIFCQSWLRPRGVPLEFERIHSRLKFDLGALAPWMSTKKIKVYIYSDPESYISGEFHPPPWSNGLAIHSERTVVLYQQEEPSHLWKIFAHECTHVLLGSFFGEKKESPPVWLNEGVAMLMEESHLFNRDDSRTSRWYKGMGILRERSIAIEGFFESKPGGDDSDGQVTIWYTQAYSIVRYLFSMHTRFRFKRFCGEIRDGEDVGKVLKGVYRFRNLKDFERKWKKWLRKLNLPAVTLSTGEPPPRPERFRSLRESTPSLIEKRLDMRR